MQGDHVPVIPLSEVVGNDDKVAPEQIAATCVNVGVMFGFTIILISFLHVVPLTVTSTHMWFCSWGWINSSVVSPVDHRKVG